MKIFSNARTKHLFTYFTILTFFTYLTNIEDLIFGGVSGIIPVITSFLWIVTLLLLLLPHTKRTVVYNCIQAIYFLWLTIFSLCFLLGNLPGIAMKESLFVYISVLVIGTPFNGFIHVFEKATTFLLPQANAEIVVWSVMSLIGVTGLCIAAISFIKQKAIARKASQQTAA